VQVYGRLNEKRKSKSKNKQKNPMNCIFSYLSLLFTVEILDIAYLLIEYSLAHIVSIAIKIQITAFSVSVRLSNVAANYSTL